MAEPSLEQTKKNIHAAFDSLVDGLKDSVKDISALEVNTMIVSDISGLKFKPLLAYEALYRIPHKDLPDNIIKDSDDYYDDLYKGNLEYHKKDNGLFPYKYTFNCENNSIKNYCTEKLYDGILAECLVFYSGCYNIKDYLPENSFVYLELSNFEEDLKIIQTAIKEDWHTLYLPNIRAAKKKILNELSINNKLKNIIDNKNKKRK